MVNDLTDNHAGSCLKSELFQRRFCTCMFIAFLLVVTCIRIRLLNVPLERDEGEYAYIGQLILQGKLPYQHAYTMKLPGTHVFYSLFMLLFGQTIAAIHAGLLLVSTATTIMIYFLAKRLAGDIAAAVAGTVFAVMAVSNTVLGTFAHATHFVVVCFIGGLLLFFRWTDLKRPVVLFASGLMFGCAYTMKQHGIFFSVVPLSLLAFSTSGIVIDARSRLYNGLVFIMGLILPLVFIILLFLITGSYDKFIFWTVQYAKAYTETVSLDMGWRVFLNQFADVTRNTKAFWLLAGAGLIGLFLPPLTRGYRHLLTVLTFCSIAAIVPGMHFRPHYFIQILPAVAILCGVSIAVFPKLVPQRIGTALKMLLAALVFGAAGYLLYAERLLLLQLPPAEVIKRSYQTAKPFAESLLVADFIKVNTSPTDKVMVIGSEPQIYFYSQRTAGSGYIYLYSLLENQPFAERMQNEYFQEMVTSDPKFVVIVQDVASWMSDGTDISPFLNKTNRFLEERYAKVGVVDIHRNEPSQFIWGKGASLYQTKSRSYMLVLMRKQ